jgi:catechol 2,3-dioxygenase-like lactoylglutathione lyase family enzyme
VNRFIFLFFTSVLGLLASTQSEKPHKDAAKADTLNLGNFSVSLTVKDIAASRAFYEKLGFHSIMGEQEKHWLILQNETATIGLFQGVFEKNTLTFNPGWDRKAATLAKFEDVRDLQRELKSRGITPKVPADESTAGPASFILVDPDGNPILLDQHVQKPKN